jgi:uncharacterized Zn ribbon protein
MAKKAIKKIAKKSKSAAKLKDYDVVAFVIPLPVKGRMKLVDLDGIIHSIYINKYGHKIGALVQIDGSSDFLSLDEKSLEYYYSPESSPEE